MDTAMAPIQTNRAHSNSDLGEILGECDVVFVMDNAEEDANACPGVVAAPSGNGVKILILKISSHVFSHHLIKKKLIK